MIKISASLLACDLLNIQSEIKKIEKVDVDVLHFDIMDGHYVSNFAFSIDIIQKIKKITDIPIEVHLEIDNPEQFVKPFIEAGADTILVQSDCTRNPIRLLKQIRSYGAKAGFALNPYENIDKVYELYQYIDYLLIMSVEPGFGGQPFNKNSIRKIAKSAEFRKTNEEVNYVISVDGGVNTENIKWLKEAGIDIAIVGSAIFNSDDYLKTVEELKSQIVSDVKNIASL